VSSKLTGYERRIIGRAYRSHKDQLYNFCLYLTGDRQMSEDIVHDTFVNLINNRHELPTIDSMKNWLFICVRNLAYNRLKQRRAVDYRPLGDIGVESTVEQRLFIDSVLNQLDTAERELILLREQQGLAIGEIAAIMDISAEAVRVRLHRVRKKMCHLVKGEKYDKAR